MLQRLVPMKLIVQRRFSGELYQQVQVAVGEKEKNLLICIFVVILQCLSVGDIFELHDTPAAGATDKDIPGMSGSILYQVNNPQCLEEKAHPHKIPTKAESKIPMLSH